MATERQSELRPRQKTESIESQRGQILETIVWITLGFVILFTFGYILAAFLIPDFPWFFIVFALGFAGALAGALWLMQLGMREGAIGVYLVSGIVYAFVMAHYLGGMLSTLALIFPIFVVIAGLISGYRTTLITAAGIGIGYVLLLMLESTVLRPFNYLPSGLFPLVGAILFVVTIMVMVMVSEQYATYLRGLMRVLQQRDLELGEARQLGRTSGDALRRSREREEESNKQVQELVRSYVDFLSRVTGGDYEVRLDLQPVRAGESSLYNDLLILGRSLNVTVDSMASAMSEVKVVQEHYIQGSWEKLVEMSATPTAYRYQNHPNAIVEVVKESEAWYPLMQRAVSFNAYAVQNEEIAVPVIWSNNVIGVLGMRRPSGREWNEDELILMTAIADQLAQTIENLRLLDETSQRATQERVSGEITGRIREQVEIESVLERALVELSRVLEVERAVAHLALDDRGIDAARESPGRDWQEL